MLGALAFACGGDDGDDATPTPTRSPSPTATASPNSTPTPTATLPAGDLEFSADGAMAHVRALAEDIGVRAPGTEGEERAADYVREQLASYGYEAQLQEFPIDVYEGVNVVLETVAPEQHTVTASYLSGSAAGDAQAPLVYAEIGRPEEFPANTNGNIALIARGTLTFAEKVANAQAAGAVGVVVYNNQDGLLEGSLGQGEPPNIPAVGISREAGLLLQTLIQDGVTVHLAVESIVSEALSQNVVASAPGGECRVIAGGHYDSVPAGPGANDNGSGTAVVLEIARVLAARGELGEVCFVLFGSEEAGLLGSAYFVSQLSAEERTAILGMLNFDMLGVGTDWPFLGTTDMVNVAGEAAEALDISYRIGIDPVGVGSDHAPFIEAGIPAILFNCFCDPNYHLSSDRAEFVIPSRLAEGGGIGLGMIEMLLSTSP